MDSGEPELVGIFDNLLRTAWLFEPRLSGIPS